MNFVFQDLTFSVDKKRIRLVKYGDFLAETNDDLCQFANVNVAGNNRRVTLGNKSIFANTCFSLEYVEHEISDDTLVITQRNALIEVKTFFRKYGDCRVLRIHTEVRNVSGVEIILDEVSAFTLPCFGDKRPQYSKNLFLIEFSQSHHTEHQILDSSFYDRGLTSFRANSYKKILVSNTGSWSTKEREPLGFIEDRNIGKTLMFQLESNNSWFYEIGDYFDRFYLNLGDGNINHTQWHQPLAPNHIHKTIDVALVLGKSKEEAILEMNRYRKHIKAGIPNQCPYPLIFNEYMHLSWDDPNEERVRRIAPIVQKLGLEYYVIDCGWHAVEDPEEITKHLGEWLESPRRFPSGLRKTCDYLHSLGLKMGLWIEPQVVGMCNRKMIDHYGPDGFLNRFGKPISHNGRLFLDYRNAKVREYMSSAIERMILSYGADFIKMDYNQDVGVGTDKNGTSFHGGLRESEAAFLDWIEGEKKKYPTVIFETCASGGMRGDYQTLSHFPLISSSDQTSYDLYPYLIGNSFASILPEQSLIWSYPACTDEPIGIYAAKDKDWMAANISDERIAMNMINSFLGVMCLSSHLELLSELQLGLVKEGIEVYKALTPFKNEASVYLPLGFSHPEDTCVSVGLRKENRLFLSVYNLRGDKHKEIELDRYVKDARIVYPKCSKAKITHRYKTIIVDFPNEIEGVFLEIDLTDGLAFESDLMHDLAYDFNISRSDLNIVRNVIEIEGLERVYRFYQLSDMHVLYSHNPENVEAYGARNRYWTPKKNGFNPLYGFDFILNQLNAKKDIDGLFITGDLIDHFNPDSVDYVRDKISNASFPVYFVPGNHEGHIGGDLFYARRFYRSLSSLSAIPLDCGYREFESFIIASIDDSDLQITEDQIAFLKRIDEVGKPIILLLHIPIITEGLEPIVMKVWGTKFMLGTEDDTELDKRFVEAVKGSNVIAIYAGHIHFEQTSEFAKGKHQYCAAPGFEGYLREIILKPKGKGCALEPTLNDEYMGESPALT